MKRYRLSALVTCEVRCTVHAHSLRDAVARANAKGLWGSPIEIGYTPHDCADADLIDADNRAQEERKDAP